MSYLEVLIPGFLTTVQDLGRFGYQQYGMGTAGAMDSFSLRVGNLLVGNEEGAACLEATLTGPKLLFYSDTTVAVTGADMDAKLNDKSAPLWQSFFVPANSILEFRLLKEGCRTCICVAGGIQVSPVMGSRSTYLRGSIGGFKGRKLAKGDLLPILESRDLPFKSWQLRKFKESTRPKYKQNEIIRAVLGPQDNYFTSASLDSFFSRPFIVTENSDRMGYRLKGFPLQHKGDSNIISDGIPLGGIQVPGHGNPIIMLVDRPTTGGYPKIATIITSDLHRVAQLKPGDEIRFMKVTLEQAYAALKEYEKRIYEIKEITSAPEKRNLRVSSTTRKVYQVTLGKKVFTVEIEEMD